MRKKDLTPVQEAKAFAKSKGIHTKTHCPWCFAPRLERIKKLAESYLALRKVVKEQRRTIAALQ